MTDLIATTDTSTSAHDALHRLALEYLRLANAHDVNAMLALHTPDFVARTRSRSAGIEDYRALLSGFFTTFPDAVITPIHVVVEGDRVVLHVEMAATNTGADFMGEPVSGKPVRFSSVHVVRIQDARIAESWGLIDTPTFLDQLR